jgi:anti-sigma regulatory factor (Ser/Thr protein kinase)
MLRRLEFPRDEQAPAAARRSIEEFCSDLKPEALDSARLLVSELVTNSVLHGAGGSITVVLDKGLPDVLRCEVIDDGSGFVPRARADRAVGGWGLEIVERLASSWGVREGSTHVWFDLPIADGSDG